MKTAFIKIHVPLPVIERYAEVMNLKMPIKRFIPISVKAWVNKTHVCSFTAFTFPQCRYFTESRYIFNVHTRHTLSFHILYRSSQRHLFHSALCHILSFTVEALQNKIACVKISLR
uniref:Anoctamin dimerisation domain-containing protein n=1 Tax=Cacopsylla melanoneura TaxID=428564 RepID=A0A8D8ZCR8_9HEMI